MPTLERCKANKGLPPNLYAWQKWYRYRNPQTGQYTGMGSNRAKAVAAARQLNSILMPGQDLIAQVLNTQTVFAQFLDIFTKEIIPERKLAKKTLEMYKQKLVHIRKHLGDKPTNLIQVKDVAEFLSYYPPRSSNQYRILLSDIFKYAIARGLCENNPALSTIPKKETKKRQRMTLEGYQAIYAQAPQWLQNAMDLSLHTLQRREDVAKMRFEDIKDGYLYVIQEKTEKHGACAYLKIKITSPLQAIIQRCRSDNIPSPYLVHRIPERIAPKSQQGAEREHLTQCLPEFISKQLKKAREKAKVYDHLPAEERPSFHEIRSLGAKLYKDAGIDPQSLLGHTNKKMTDHYLSGHGIQWTETQAGLILPKAG